MTYLIRPGDTVVIRGWKGGKPQAKLLVLAVYGKYAWVQMLGQPYGDTPYTVRYDSIEPVIVPEKEVTHAR